jgi:hypothetical protein
MYKGWARNLALALRPSMIYWHIKKHKYNLTQGLLEKLKLAQHAYEEGHKIL